MGLLFILATMALCLVFITLVAALEKRMLWPYVAPDTLAPEFFPLPNSYAHTIAAAAGEAGFTWLGAYAHGAGKLYKVRYDFYLAPERDVLALVGTGALASIAVQTTSLITLLEDGRSLVTVDHQNGIETDLAGLALDALVVGLGFAGQLAAHRTRLLSIASPAMLMDGPDPLAALLAFRQRRVDRMVALGYAGYLDTERAWWRYSPKGAAQLAFRQYFKGLYRAVTPTNPAPAFVLTTVRLLGLYFFVLLGNAVALAAYSNRWGILAIWASLSFTGFWLLVGLTQLKRGYWWTVTLGGFLLAAFSLLALLNDVARLVLHGPFRHPFSVPVHLAGLLLLAVVVRLCMRPSRIAFGLAKPPPTVPDLRAVDPAPAGVWPPPPSL